MGSTIVTRATAQADTTTETQTVIQSIATVMTTETTQTITTTESATSVAAGGRGNGADHIYGSTNLGALFVAGTFFGAQVLDELVYAL